MGSRRVTEMLDTALPKPDPYSPFEMHIRADMTFQILKAVEMIPA
ncbi:MAG: hypothetical protein ACSHXZ_10035 [Gammaproteobacteria bacterium]